MVSRALYLLDTNMVTYIVTGKSRQARQRFDSLLDSGRIAVSAITEGEIQFGIAKRPEAVRINSFMSRFLEDVGSLPWASASAQTYGDLRAKLQGSGESLSSLDSLIAAHAITLRATLVTHDHAFSRLVPLLSVEDWATDL